MKKILVLALVLAVALVAAQANAFNIESAVKGAAKSASKGAIESQMNADIKKKMGNCKFKPNSTETTCNVNKIIAGLSSANRILEGSGLASDCNIHIEAHAPDYKLANNRANALRNKLKTSVNYWDYYVSGKKKAPHDQLKIWVKLR